MSTELTEQVWAQNWQHKVDTLTQENARLRAALKEIGDWCDGQNLYVTRIARDALNAPTAVKLVLEGKEAPAPADDISARREIERLRAALDIIAFDYTKESNGPGRADWFQAVAREALKPKPNLVEELVP